MRPAARVQVMRIGILETFEFYVDDDRYAVPTLVFAPADDAQDAVAIAERLLKESVHYRGVEVFLEGVRISGLGSLGAGRILAPTPANSVED